MGMTTLDTLLLHLLLLVLWLHWLHLQPHRPRHLLLHWLHLQQVCIHVCLIGCDHAVIGLWGLFPCMAKELFEHVMLL